LSQTEKQFFVVLPCFGDSKSAQELCHEMNSLEIAPRAIVLLDDSMGIDHYDNLPSNAFVVRATNHLGQQRLLTQFFRHGFADLFRVNDTDVIVVMDSDGEDKVGHIPILIEHLSRNQCSLVLARRASRKSTTKFKFGYIAFRLLSKFLTGKSVNSGTFSASNWNWLKIGVQNKSFNASFSGGLIAAPGNKGSVKLDRDSRRYGVPKVSTNGLVQYALDLFVSMGRLIAIRIFFYLMFAVLLSIVAIIAILALRILELTVPGYASIFIVLIFQTIGLLLVLFLGSLQIERLLEVREPAATFSVVIHGESKHLLVHPAGVEPTTF